MCNQGYGALRDQTPRTFRCPGWRLSASTSAAPGTCYPVLSLQENGLCLSNSSPTDPTNGRILRFRPRGSLLTRNPPQKPPASSPVEDLGKYERPAGEDDYRHRMTMNGLAIAATVALIVLGLWIADTMAQMRKNQDCVLSGRRGCAPVDAPIAPRY